MSKGKKTTMQDRVARAAADQSYRRGLCAELCRHLASGYSVKSFCGTTPGHISRLRAEYPDDFPEDEIELAIACGQDSWEKIGRRQAEGSCLGNSKSWIYNMSNRYGWRERTDVSADVRQAVSVSIVDYSTKKKPCG